MDTHEQEQANTLAQEHEQEERKQEGRTIEQASKALGDILRRHKEGEPILAEMAARIEARANSI